MWLNFLQLSDVLIKASGLKGDMGNMGSLLSKVVLLASTIEER